MNPIDFSEYSEDAEINKIIAFEKKATKNRTLYFVSIVVLAFIAVFGLMAFTMVVIPSFVYNYVRTLP
jgi:uncharacterized protein YqhQ